MGRLMWTLVLGAWLVVAGLLTTLFLRWSGSLFVAVPAAVAVATIAALLLVRPERR